MRVANADDAKTRKGNPTEVLAVFLKLGCTSFGGPIAHLGYFRAEIVERRKWVTESQFAQLLAICQFLPGPASSQLGFSLGLVRAGFGGGLMAFLAFTLPSALLLVAFATSLPHLSGPVGAAVVHGLKIVAVAVVSHGLLGMARRLCADSVRKTIAFLAAVLILTFDSAGAQLCVVALGAVVGSVLCGQAESKPDEEFPLRYGTTTGCLLLGCFAVLLTVLPLAANGAPGTVTICHAFYRAGALVFGGGHVVLPLLEESVVEPGWVSQEQFLAGYGASQAIPGPMFSFSAYLGAVLPDGHGGFTGALTALLAIFVPGFLLIAGILPFWRHLSRRRMAAGAIAGINAAVVGLLGSALYAPVFVSAIGSRGDLATALIGLLLLSVWQRSPLVVVAWCVSVSVIRSAVLAV